MAIELLCDWVATGGYAEPEYTIVQDSDTSLKLWGTNAGLKQRIPLEHLLKGLTLTAKAWVYGLASSAPKVRITVGGTNYDSPTVAADHTWEQLSVSHTLTTDYLPIWVSVIANDAGNYCYFDGFDLRTQSPAVSVLPISEACHALRRVEIAPVSDTTAPSNWRWQDGPLPEVQLQNYGRLPYNLSTDYWVRLTGTGQWPDVDERTDVVDIQPELAQLVAIRAAIHRLNIAISQRHLGLTEQWQQDLARMQAEEQQVIARLSRPVELQKTFRLASR